MQLRLVDFNYAFQDATVITASSADPEFPSTNLKAAFRSKVLRFYGTFVITAGVNDKLNFNIGAGEVTATLTAGTYTPTTLAAEIVTRMNAAAAGTYTCTFSRSTGKWTITKSAGTLSLLAATGTNVATGVWSSIGFSATDRTGALTYTGSSIALHTEESVVFDLVTSEAIDSFAMFFDKMSGMNLSSSAALRLQANATNAWSAPSVDVALTIDTVYEAVSHFFSSDQTYRYWRLKVVDPANADLYVELGKIVLGKAIQVADMPSNSFTHSVDDTSTYQETDYGHRYGDVYPLRKKLAIEYAALSYTEIQTLETAFRRNGRGTPILLSFDSTAEFYDKDHFLLYAYFDSELEQRHLIKNRFSQAFTFKEAF